MRAVQCGSSRLILRQAIRGFTGDAHRRVRMRICRFALAIFMLANIVSILTLASITLTNPVSILTHASADLPHPTWLVGIYDESDGDSAVWLIERTQVTNRRESVNDGGCDSDVRPPVHVILALRYLSDSLPAF